MTLLFAVDLCFCPHKDIWGEGGATRLVTDSAPQYHPPTRKPALYLLGSLSDTVVWPQGSYMGHEKERAVTGQPVE